jgi:DNA-binding transcriptional LysR family regulator
VPRHPSELQSHTCLLLRSLEGTAQDLWVFERGDERVEVRVDGWVTVANAHRDVLSELALRGEGIHRAIDWASASELRRGALVTALEDWAQPEAPPVNVIYAPQARRVPRVRAFLAFAEALFGDAPERDTSGIGRMPDWMHTRLSKASDVVARRASTRRR